MGFGGISIWQLLIVVAIVVTIFGTHRLRGLGSDLGTAVRHFRDGLRAVGHDGESPRRPAPRDSRPS